MPGTYIYYDVHGNVGEWVWDWYGNYETGEQTDPTGPDIGTLRVNRGGGWNDFAKNLRSAYRATLPPDSASFNLGLRLVRNAGNGSGNVESSSMQTNGQTGGSILIAYFSWGGNTRGIAQEIQRQTGAELFEIELVTPYSTDYNTVLDQAQRVQNEQARPELSNLDFSVLNSELSYSATHRYKFQTSHLLPSKRTFAGRITPCTAF